MDFLLRIHAFLVRLNAPLVHYLSSIFINRPPLVNTLDPLFNVDVLYCLINLITSLVSVD